MKKKIKIPKGFEVSKVIDHSKSDKPRITINLKKEPSKDELLEKAKRDYYKGVIYKDCSGRRSKDCEVMTDKYIQNEHGIWAARSNGWLLYNGVWSKIIKKPVIKVQGKWLYEGDEYWWINKLENWKLYKAKCNINQEGSFRCDNAPEFLTKQSALDYVMVEAERRFDNNNLYILDRIDSLEIYSIFGDERFILWTKEHGFIAEPVKQPKLMLGEFEVYFTNEYPLYCSTHTEDNKIIIIKCNGGQVTKEEWMKWVKVILPVMNQSQVGLTDYIVSKYETGTYDDDFIYIGCIKNVTIKQIEAITDKLNEL